MRIKLWGVRGSLPTPMTPDDLRARLLQVLQRFEAIKSEEPGATPEEFLNSLPTHLSTGYGGLRGFSEHIQAADAAISEFHVYMTHFHWDHLIGLPFFLPLYRKGVQVHFYGVHDDLEDSLRRLFRKPNFPVPYDVVAKQILVHRVEPRRAFQVGDVQVTPYMLDHPDPCWGARVEADNRALAWAVDTECPRTSSEELGADLALYKNADLMVFDAQYSFDEALDKINWGHASGPIGIDLALRENIKRALFVHHDPGASDDMIRSAEDQASLYFNEIVRARRRVGETVPELDWRFAREGEVIQL